MLFMKVVSFFAGAGGLDLGFERAGFEVVWANEFDKEIWETYRKNHKHTILDTRSIVNVPSSDVPDCDGIIGGPPCQSWSEAGAKRGIADKRGQLFYEFMRILADKKPKFFLAENVSGMLLSTHRNALNNIKQMFTDIGYDLSFKLVNVSDYRVPQDRKRIFFVGYRKDLGLKFVFPTPTTAKNKITLRQAIFDLKDNAIQAKHNNATNGDACVIPNHEYMNGGFSTIYMSRNRVRSWDEVSFTIQAGGRHAPIHPQAPKMVFIEQNKREFVKEQEHLYRRLSVRECARIQTFPDNFIFYYDNVAAAYKMIGNAVPVRMAHVLAKVILNDLSIADLNDYSVNINSISNVNGHVVLEKMNEIIGNK
jgi:DNA (cytosine-5)-methyltransferase 1